MKLAFALLALLASGFVVPAAASDSLLPQRVSQAVHERVAAGEYPALVVAVVDGSRSQVHGFGKLDDGTAPDASTGFEIGSVTKTFTALLLADQVVQRKVQLDTPVAALLPGVSVPSRNGKAITLEQLATQHSGLPRLPGNLVPAGTDPYADYDADKLKAFLAGFELKHDPGSAYGYSNLGFGLLGYALSRQSHASYAQLLQQRIFGPLGMSHSTAQPDGKLRRQMAGGHDQDGHPTAPWTFDVMAGAGAITSTGADMLRYLRANMGQLHSPLWAAMQLAHTPRADVPELGQRIGLAWMERTDGDRTIIWHNGMTGGYASFIGYTADGKRGVVVLTNQQQSVDDLGMAVLLPDMPLRPARKTVHLATGRLDAYVGSYRLAPSFVLKVFRAGGQLYAQATGQGAFPLFPSGGDEFFAKVGDISISFQRKQGKVDGLVLHQHGDHPAPRIADADVLAHEPKTVSLPHNVLASYVGRYRLAPGVVFDISLQGEQLFAQLTGQPSLPVYASSRDHFFYRVVPAQLEFLRDAAGNVTALVLHQGGADQRAARIDE